MTHEICRLCSECTRIGCGPQSCILVNDILIPTQGGVVHNPGAGAEGGYAMQVDDAPVVTPMAPPMAVPYVDYMHHELVALHGQWRDGLCECCGVDGASSLCMALWFPCCTPCLFAKISSRISWSWTGLRGCGPTTFVQWFRFLLVLAIVYLFCSFNYSVFASLAQEQYQEDIRESPYYKDGRLHVEVSDETKELHMWAIFFDFGTWVTGAVFFALLVMLRQRVRARFYIPAACEGRAGDSPFCGLVEDMACMLACQPCAAAQMARHTLALVGERCDPSSDPGPIEVFPAVQAPVPPASINSMQQFPAHGHGVAPPIAHVPTATGQVVPVGQLVQGHFPAPASVPAAGLPTATITPQNESADVPVAAHVTPGMGRSEARAAQHTGPFSA